MAVIMLVALLILGLFVGSAEGFVSASMSYSGPTSVGSRLQLDCKVTVPPGARVTWYKNYRQIFSPRVSFSSITRNNELHHLLTIATVQSTDAGRYRCQVSDGTSTARSSVQVNVRAAGGNGDTGIRPVLPSRGSQLSVRLNTAGSSRAGRAYRFDCRVTAPSGSIVRPNWYKDGQILSESSGRTFSTATRPDGQHYIYSIASLDTSDSGRYRCEALGQTGRLVRSERGLYVWGGSWGRFWP